MNTNTTTTNRHACKCGSTEKLIRIDRFDRGSIDRDCATGLICESCLHAMLTGTMGAKAANESTGAKLKDVRSQLSFRAVNPDATFAAWCKTKGYAPRMEGAHGTRYLSVTSDKLNRVIKHCASLKLHTERGHINGLQSVRLTLSSETNGVPETHFAWDGETELAQWIRETEHKFCTAIGCPQWSALNTGTRKGE